MSDSIRGLLKIFNIILIYFIRGRKIKGAGGEGRGKEREGKGRGRNQSWGRKVA